MHPPYYHHGVLVPGGFNWMGIVWTLLGLGILAGGIFLIVRHMKARSEPLPPHREGAAL